MGVKKNIIIIGSGMAGYTLLREIRKIDTQIKITLICADSGDFYSKPMLSNALDKNKTPDSLVTQRADMMVKSQGFELINYCNITSIDTDKQEISDGSTNWHYNKLILATGAHPFVLPVDGDAASDILSVNSLDDYRVFYSKLEQSQKIAIIGPGLIGCEFANDLLSADKQITIIGPDPWPISSLLPEAVGHFLQLKLEHETINFHLKNTVKSVNRTESGYQLTLQDDNTLEADLVLSAVGLRANMDLAPNSDIKTNRAYITNLLLQTSIQNIYALGDCAEVQGFHLPYIMPIMQCARALAKTLTGTETKVSYPAMPVAIKTPACPLVVAPPAAEQQIHWQITESANAVKALCVNDDDKLIGFALAGEAVSEKQTLSRALPATL